MREIKFRAYDTHTKIMLPKKNAPRRTKVIHSKRRRY